MSMEERRAWIARRDTDRVRAADRERYYRDHAKRRAASDAYQRANPERVTEANQRWADRNPEKRAAQIAAGNAMRDGRLIRQGCEVCGEKGQAHHDDYSKPLEVRWLCPKHHAALHAAIRRAA